MKQNIASLTLYQKLSPRTTGHRLTGKNLAGSLPHHIFGANLVKVGSLVHELLHRQSILERETDRQMNTTNDNTHMAVGVRGKVG